MRGQSRRRLLRGSLGLAGVGLLAGCGILPPQLRPPAKVPRIGYIAADTRDQILAEGTFEAFRGGIRDLGYVEGESILIEDRYPVSEAASIPAIASELVRLKVDLIVSGGPGNTIGIRGVTRTVPIVMASGGDPVAAGVVTNLAHPGGNVTGVSSMAHQTVGKRLELLKQVVPNLSRVAVFGAVDFAPKWPEWLEAQSAAPKLGLEVFSQQAPASSSVASMFRLAVAQRADAMLVLSQGGEGWYRAEIAALALQARLPTIAEIRTSINADHLLSYGPSLVGLSRQAATYVDKILKGAKPGDLPIEQATVLDFVINLKTARTLGLTIPQSVLQQATEVIQ